MARLRSIQVSASRPVGCRTLVLYENLNLEARKNTKLLKESRAPYSKVTDKLSDGKAANPVATTEKKNRSMYRLKYDNPVHTSSQRNHQEKTEKEKTPSTNPQATTRQLALSISTARHLQLQIARRICLDASTTRLTRSIPIPSPGPNILSLWI